MKYFAKIKYLGTDFHGFQFQPNDRTVQGELTSAFRSLFSTDVKITGCSRTDAGVHANEFCITAELDGATIPPEKLPEAIKRFLPKDISLYYAEIVGDEFHPRYSARGKEYVYRIKNSRISDPFLYSRVWFLPQIIDDLGIEKIRSCIPEIVGKRDFASFMAEGSSVESTVREVYSLNVEKNDDIIEFSISADGFLYNMVRIIVGTLVEVALGRIAPMQIRDIIASCDRSRAGMTAPADGLYLNKVFY
jgi:tRNA pseudouridine38-40 synthase